MSAIGTHNSPMITQLEKFVDIYETNGSKALKKESEKLLKGQYNNFITHCLLSGSLEEVEICAKLCDRIDTFSEETAMTQITKAIKHRLSKLIQTSKNSQDIAESIPLNHQEDAWIFKFKKPDLSVGNIYFFQMQPIHFEAEMDLLKSLNPNHIRNPAFKQLLENRKIKQFPAVELEIHNILDFQEKIGTDILGQLGYYFGDIEDKEFYIGLPDKWSFEMRWAHLQEQRLHLELPDFRIINSDQTPSDYDFAKGNRKGILLSNGPDFLHDHLHILAKIARCIQSPKLEKQMTATLDRIIKSGLHHIKLLKAKNVEELKHQISELEFILGAFIDLSSAKSSFGMPYFFERQNFEHCVKKLITIHGGAVSTSIDMKLNESIQREGTFDEFTNLTLDKKLLEYVRDSSGWPLAWEKRFGNPLDDKKIDQLASLLTNPL